MGLTSTSIQLLSRIPSPKQWLLGVAPPRLPGDRIQEEEADERELGGRGGTGSRAMPTARTVVRQASILTEIYEGVLVAYSQTSTGARGIGWIDQSSGNRSRDGMQKPQLEEWRQGSDRLHYANSFDILPNLLKDAISSRAFGFTLTNGLSNVSRELWIFWPRILRTGPTLHHSGPVNLKLILQPPRFRPRRYAWP